MASTKDPATRAKDRLRGDSSERSQTDAIVVVEVAGERIGIRAEAVAEVQPAVATTTLPGAPRIIEGIFDLRGEMVPVISGRVRLGVETRVPQLSDRFVVVRTDAYLVALRVDAAIGLVEVRSVDLDRAVALAPDTLQGVGLARLDDGLVVVHDPDSFLSAEESAVLEAALVDRRPS